MNRKVLTVLVGIVIVFFVVFPHMVCQGAKTGLLLWFDTVLPALLPFMVLSNFMIHQNITEGVSRIAAPVFTRLFGLSKAGCYPAVIGLLSGYPIGAKTAAQLYREQMITKEEAQYLLVFCNNASPMFLLEYMGVYCMGLLYPAVLPGIIYLSAFLGAFLCRIGRQAGAASDRDGRRQGHKLGRIFRGMCNFREGGGEKVSRPHKKTSVIVSLDESILDAFVTITKIGGYIILFSILAQIAAELLPFPGVAKYIGIGILEITTGGAVLAKAAIPEAARSIILAGLCAFGGLSSVAQTASVLGETDLRVGGYLFAKIRQAVLAMALAALWFID